MFLSPTPPVHQTQQCSKHESDYDKAVSVRYLRSLDSKKTLVNSKYEVDSSQQ